MADATVGLAVLAGWAPPRLVEPERLRIAVSTRSPDHGRTRRRPARAAVASAARALRAAGHGTTEASPRYPTSLGLRTLATWCSAATDTAAGLDESALQRRTRRHVALGRLAQRRGLVREADRSGSGTPASAWFADYDVLVTPALASTPPSAGPWHGKSWAANLLTCLRYAPFLAAWNVAGFPALVLPAGVRPDGLPVAVQLVGPPGSELLLLAVAGQLEQASPWLRHAPGYPRPAIPSQR